MTRVSASAFKVPYWQANLNARRRSAQPVATEPTKNKKRLFDGDVCVREM
jgi:hypothetical protein